MGRLLDHVLTIDVSLTCWSGPPPPGQCAEILEIGVCPVDIRSGRLLEQRSLIVVPESSTISAYCTALTSIDRDDLARGFYFPEACDILRREYGSYQRVWASYGNHIRRHIKQQCALRAIEYPFGSSHVNLRTLLAILRAQPAEQSLPDCMLSMNLPFVGERHRASDRARNAALLLARLMVESRMKWNGGTN